MAPWCGSAECEKAVSAANGATIRVIPFDSPDEPGACVVGRPTERAARPLRPRLLGSADGRHASERTTQAMAILCRDIGLLLLQAPHTGSTSLGTLLRTELGGEMLVEERVRDARGRIVLRQKHQTLAQLLEAGLVTPEQREDLLVVVGVRNPFDLVVTEYARNREAGAISAPQRLLRRLPGLGADFTPADVERFVRRRYEPGLPVPDRRPAARSYPVDWTAGADHVIRFEAMQDGPRRGAAPGGGHRAGTSCRTATPRSRARSSDYRALYTRPGACHRGAGLRPRARAARLRLRRLSAAATATTPRRLEGVGCARAILRRRTSGRLKRG